MYYSKKQALVGCVFIIVAFLMGFIALSAMAGFYTALWVFMGLISIIVFEVGITILSDL